MDFYRILTKETKTGLELYPDFIVGRSKDLMVQGRSFYAIWDEERGLWSRDEYDVQRLVDADLDAEADRLKERLGVRPSVKYMSSFGSNSWAQFRKFLQHVSDNAKPLDAKLIFANTDVKKTDYASKRLPYAIGEGVTDAWEELTSTLYSPEERAKIEWAIGSIVSGDSKRIQKFFVLYGPPGTGKSTILNIIQALFEGYTTTFDGKALGNSNASFATEVFKHNPLVAIQHDGDLSRIEDNARLNSVIAHEQMTMNEKYKPSFTSRVDALLFIGSNQPVKISDAKSGIIRRLIDIHPTGVMIPTRHFHTLLTQIDFELGAIAHRCLMTYLELGKNFYNGYRPLEMMLQTDVFFNFIEAYYDVFKRQDYTYLKQAYNMYKEFCEESGIPRPLPQYKMREELRNYFDDFKERGEVDGDHVRSFYSGFNAEKFKAPTKEGNAFSLVMEETESLLDELLADQPAQLGTKEETPTKKWTNVTSKLKDINTGKLHFVKVPENHIVIDFDLKDVNGTKSLERNLQAASQWPPTYAEYSKSGSGIHLHYEYAGDVGELDSEYAEGIEVKVYRGDASLRRQLSRCNAVQVAVISSGLPLKQKKEKMLKAKTITSEKGLRDLIERNLRKEIHPGTKPSVDFIAKILEDAFESDLKYDVSDLRPRLIAFAMNSTNQPKECMRVVRELKYSSDEVLDGDPDVEVEVNDDRIVFFDVEVYPNLFVVCWKFHGQDEVVRMINPKPHEVEELFRLKLVGFYNRRYDNHILYAASLGFSPEQLYRLSMRLVEGGNKNASFGAAYNLSYADIWDFSTKRMSLKKFELELGIIHMELDLPWNQPVDKKDWDRVVEYCCNDVRATEAVFEDRKEDFRARRILADLAGMTVNDTTQNLTARIIFGDDKNPQKKFKYESLAGEFPGYVFDWGKSSYKGEDPGEGGYVYAEPGIYENVAVLDVASMHPTTIEVLDLFGPYTQKYADLKAARIAIKRKDFAAAREMLDGRLAPYLEDESGADALAYSLKIAINIVYGLTSAKFQNPFKDPRNVDNIVAKRGALFMIELKELIQSSGYQVVHIKTDSVKIPNADQEIISKVIEFGKKYGYEFDHEATYDKFCLVNDAVYVAGKLGEWEAGTVMNWEAVGAQFQHPYVFKELFSHEPLRKEDYREAKSVVQGNMYLDVEGSDIDQPDHTKMRHIGKTGLFVPVKSGGGLLYRVKDDKYYAVSGTKGHLWAEAVSAEMKKLPVDFSYFEKLKDTAIRTIEKFGSFGEFVKQRES